jgi:adenosylmethionine-8-amino-7-oxononanoate aminotransferase
LIPRVQAMGRHLEAALRERFGNHLHVGDIRGRGLFWALEFVVDRASKEAFEPARKLNLRIQAEAIARGLATYPMGGTIDGTRGDHVILAPPYIVTAPDIDTIVERLGDAVDVATRRI